jgi:3-oxoacyl-[acyl-carrier protein] reductase
VLRLHERGASVAVNVRDDTPAAEVAALLGDRGLAAPGDVAVPGVPAATVQRTLDRFGRVDILVNNAALARSTRFPDLSEDEFRQAVDVNLIAPFAFLKAVLPVMTAQRYGRIVNISSTAGRMVSTLGGAHYTAAKAALLGLTRAAAKELGRFGTTVNAVGPGMIDTDDGGYQSGRQGRPCRRAEHRDRRTYTCRGLRAPCRRREMVLGAALQRLTSGP